MSTLLIRLAAPLQSWGSDSKFVRRSAGREPTKSGVVGLCACAMGIRRGDDMAISRLATLKFGVRIDQPGVLVRDFHIAHQEEYWENGGTDPLVSERYYLADAVFLAGLNSADDGFLKTIDAALKAPRLPVYLGRRACPPSGKLSLGTRDAELLEALRNEPWLASSWFKHKSMKNVKHAARPQTLEIICDAPDGTPMRDAPISFDQRHRKYGVRYAERHESTVRPATVVIGTLHDPFSALGR